MEFTCLWEQLILFFSLTKVLVMVLFQCQLLWLVTKVWCLTRCYSQLYSDARNDPNYSEFRTGWLAWDIRLFPVTAAIPSSRVARCTPISVQEQPESQSQFFYQNSPENSKSHQRTRNTRACAFELWHRVPSSCHSVFCGRVDTVTSLNWPCRLSPSLKNSVPTWLIVTGS